MAISLIGIYRALGSGWQIRLNQPLTIPTGPANVPQPPVDNLEAVKDHLSINPTKAVLDQSSGELVSSAQQTEFVGPGPVDRILRNQLIQQAESLIDSPTDAPSGSVILESTVQIREVAESTEP